MLEPRARLPSSCLKPSTTPNVAAAIGNVDAWGENVGEEVHGTAIDPTGDDAVNKTVQARTNWAGAMATGDDALAIGDVALRWW